MSARRPTLVVLRALKLGDFVASIPALRALASAFPLHRRVLCMPRTLAPLVPLARAVDELVDTRELGPIDPSLCAPAVAVNLHGRGPQSTASLAALRPGRLIAFSEASWCRHEHERVRWCRLLEEHGIPADPENFRLRAPAMPAPPPALGATVVHPGAASGARRWPPERFAAVAARERRAGRRVVVTGNDQEVDLACRVAASAGLDDEFVLAGRTSLIELAATIAAASRVCSNDTGVAHLATALGTPSVVLFGPIPPSEWGPPADDPRHRALWKGQRGDPHAGAPAAGLLEITVDEVAQALDELPTAS
jgi:ADP-heptose:LPS heptosyltransferase